MRRKRGKRTRNAKEAAGILLLVLLLAVMALSGCRRKTEEFTLTEYTGEELPGEVSLQGASMQELPQTRETGQEEKTGAETGNAEPEKAYCYVHICGEVEHPGVYKLEAGSRVYEAAELAGGFTALAAEDYVNQADVVEDGMKIVIPSLQQIEETESGWDITDENAGIYRKAAQEEQEQKVNINTAGPERLCTLPGIGESRARSIIAYREAHGGFRSIEEIMQVEGIKEGAFAKIQDQISVE